MGLDPVGVSREDVGSLGVLVAGTGGSGSISASSRGGGAGGRRRHVVAVETGTVLAGEGEELVALGALRNLDAVLVGPLLDLAVGPRVE